MSKHDSWDDPKYVKPADCDELGYCVDCRSATVHRAGCSLCRNRTATLSANQTAIGANK